MEEEKQVWTIEELVAMTETVQSAELEYMGKILPIQWCELTESEEPKMTVPDETTPEEEVNEYYKGIAQQRTGRMIEKANKLSPDTATLTAEAWDKLPTTIRWQISGQILVGATSQDFTTGLLRRPMRYT